MRGRYCCSVCVRTLLCTLLGTRRLIPVPLRRQSLNYNDKTANSKEKQITLTNTTKNLILNLILPWSLVGFRYIHIRVETC